MEDFAEKTNRGYCHVTPLLSFQSHFLLKFVPFSLSTSWAPEGLLSQPAHPAVSIVFFLSGRPGGLGSGWQSKFCGLDESFLAIQDSQMIEKIKKHRKDPIQKRTQNHNEKKKKYWGCLGLRFHPKISIFLYSSLNIEVMGKDNTFLRVIILAHQESGGF